MRIGIMGAGAVGSYFGAKLAQAGKEVVFVARGEHLARMRRDGLRVKSTQGDFALHVNVVEQGAEAGVCDLVLFCVKSQDSATTASQMEPMLGEKTVVVSLQNGVENEDILCGLLGRDKVLGGLCYVGARIDHPGEVIHSAAGRVVIGELDGRRTIRLAEVEGVFSDAGVPVEVSETIVVDQWKKLAWNLSFNTISALTRATVGQMVEAPACRSVVRDAIAEAVAVGRARGVELEEGLPEKIIDSNAAFAELKTSMLQDVEKGRPLEFEALNGVVCRYGREAGIATPVNDTLYGLAACLDGVLRG